MKTVTPKSKTKRPSERAAGKAAAPAARPRPQARPASPGARRKVTKEVARPAAKSVAKPVKAVAKPVAAPPKVPAVVKKVVPTKGMPTGPMRPLRKGIPVPVAKVAPMNAKLAAKLKAKEHAEALQEFGAKDYIVYPTHGVGYIQAIERQEIAGMHVDLFVITFEKDKMTLRVPVSKAKSVGMRKLSTPKIMDSALNTLKGRARVKRTMWSRRAQEYEAKINSGNPVSIAEVIRDLHRSANQPDQSYSERQIYEAALERLARELAAVEKIDEQAATARLENVLRAA
jgi:CarD family transcriptional regulator